MVNMIRSSLTLMAGVVSLAFLQADTAAAQSRVEFIVSGNSTIRGWTCTVTGSAEVATGSAAPAPGLANGVQSATLIVPVSDFVCPQDEMREHLLEAMRPDEYPEIRFELQGYEPGGQSMVTTGSLTIQATTQTVRFPISLTPAGAGVRITGEVPLDMTTYGVEPPDVMLGLMVVRPRIRIEFSGVLIP